MSTPRPREVRLNNNQRVILREATPADAARLLTFIHEVSAQTTFLTFGKNEFNVTQTQEAAFLEAAQKDPAQLYLIAEQNTRVVASLNFVAGKRARTKHSGEFGVSVLREFWGQGIAGALLDMLIDWARAGGVVTKINLRVRSDNVRAVRLYERKGFEREGVLRRELRVDDTYFDLLAMGLVLDA